MEFFKLPGYNPPPMHVNPKIQLRKRRCAQNAFCAGPQTKLRTDRKLPVLYYISYGYIFPHTNHHSKKSARAVDEYRRKVFRNPVSSSHYSTCILFRCRVHKRVHLNLVHQSPVHQSPVYTSIRAVLSDRGGIG